MCVCVCVCLYAVTGKNKLKMYYSNALGDRDPSCMAWKQLLDGTSDSSLIPTCILGGKGSFFLLSCFIQIVTLYLKNDLQVALSVVVQVCPPRVARKCGSGCPNTIRMLTTMTGHSLKS